MSLDVVMPTQHPEVPLLVAPTVPTFDHVINFQNDGRTVLLSASVPVSRQDSSPRPVPGRSARRPPGARHPADPAMTPLYDQRGEDRGEPIPAHTAKMAAAIASSRCRARRPDSLPFANFPEPATS